MSHVVIPNNTIFATNEAFNTIWKLTRGLLAAGWKYRASGDATGAAKEVSGATAQLYETAFALDRWGVGGGVNLTQVGSQTATAAFTIAAAVSGASVITSLTGFTANSVGRFLVITGALNANNNGTFRITVFNSATSVTIFNPGAVAETTPTTSTWTEKQGGAVASITASGTGGAIAGRAILTGLTGMVAPTTTPLFRGSTGDRITIAGAATGGNNGTFMITRVVSATSVEIDISSATTDANNGALFWTEISPLAQTYGLHLQGATGQGAWINLQGPSTLKIPVGANVATGTFIKGEVINETTSGAQGVILGLCLDSVSGNALGYIVVEPRLNGTGGGVRGWSTGADTITGVNSGATISVPTALTPVEYIREIVIWKNLAASGHIYQQTVDRVGESAFRFSVLTAGATATICPGGGTGTFPLIGSLVAFGTGGSNAASTGFTTWFNTSTTTNLGNGQIICQNNIEGSGVSMDGSFIVAQGTPNNSPASYIGTMYMRCDDGEEGDVDPYVFWAPASTGQFPMGGSTRTLNATQNGGSDFWRGDSNAQFFGGAFSPWLGFRRRGFSTGDAYQQFTAHCLGANSGSTAVNTNPVSPGHPATQATTLQFIREAIWVISWQFGFKMRKGSLRWVLLTEGGVTNNTYASGTWLQLGTTVAGAIVVGPWDGQTIATNG